MGEKKAAEIILELLKTEKISQTELATKMGTDRRNLNQMINRCDDIKFEKFRDILHQIGYHIEIVKN